MPSTVLLKLSKKRATSIQPILKSAMPVTECTNLTYPILPCCVFKRDVYGVTSVDKLSDEQKAATANEMMDYLFDRYGVDTAAFTPEHILEILSLRLSMSANSYNRYMSFTIANEVLMKRLQRFLKIPMNW